MGSIRNIAVGLPVKDDHVLLSESFDGVRDLRFHRAVGGGMGTRAAPNGCSYSPDHFLYVNFKPSCDKHDICCGKNSKTSRKNCDLAFRKSLGAACKAAMGAFVAQTSGCNAMAETYYLFVRNAGKSHYKGKGSKA